MVQSRIEVYPEGVIIILHKKDLKKMLSTIAKEKTNSFAIAIKKEEPTMDLIKIGMKPGETIFTLIMHLD